MARSSTVKPPSGPMRTAAGAARPFSAASGFAVCRRLVAIDQPPPRIPVADGKLASLRGSSTSGTKTRLHCSAASATLARIRSRFTRSAMVRWVITGPAAVPPVRWPSAPRNRGGHASAARRHSRYRAAAGHRRCWRSQRSVTASCGTASATWASHSPSRPLKTRTGSPPASRSTPVR